MHGQRRMDRGRILGRLPNSSPLHTNSHSQTNSSPLHIAKGIAGAGRGISGAWGGAIGISKRSFGMQSPLPSRHLLARLGSQWQVSRRPLARGCFAGRSLVFRPSLSGSLHFATSSRPPAAPFAVETRPPCASSVPLSGQPRPAGHGFQSLPFASSLRSFHPRPRAGIRSGVGVTVGPTVHLR